MTQYQCTRRTSSSTSVVVALYRRSAILSSSRTANPSARYSCAILSLICALVDCVHGADHAMSKHYILNATKRADRRTLYYRKRTMICATDLRNSTRSVSVVMSSCSSELGSYLTRNTETSCEINYNERTYESCNVRAPIDQPIQNIGDQLKVGRPKIVH